ncbi:hydantoinase/oxoprolinase family protein [Bordetella sp. BOR01]|uniref:hydantoinase/oxoprolinase family protein n=1 Tax=Bordetella sp. BOR01 TaxID=2854779 RepID=UPI001C47FB86|nr:hydantoinase/oxoprolinase family protein [Bordetella sp. BOR01]MBV7485137.1 hydantoinase/oxoprolinase family protein [Bordetella sp. BOR01]
MSEALQVAVDIGGTFTDVVGRDASGRLRYFKIPTTRQDESLAVFDAIGRIRDEWGVDPKYIERFVHGTTVATNAVLERRGAKVGLITTQGFKDVLEIGRQMRHRMYDVILTSETPSFLIPGGLRKEVPERVAADGSIVTALDEEALMQRVAELVAQDVDALAICFLFSFANPQHEQRAKALISAAYPDLTLAVSHEVDPAFREYERTVVTGFDAYVKPVIDRYLSRLENGLEKSGVQAPFQVMQSRGGLMASKVARSRPVRLFLSGPAAGVIGAQIAGKAAGTEDLITVDIGGTSSDIALISKGKAMIRSEGLIDGYPVRVAMVDVNSIGAGGGSIAWIDGAGGLRVGPRSAGSEPGPACFGRGGEQPTVTDASIVLGYLNPDYFAGGSLKLYPEKSHEAIMEKIARPLGMTVEQAALGIHRIVNAQMAEGIRLVSIRQGLDPRKFTLMPLGGGGAVHIVPLAHELSISRVVVPRYPGVLSAAGLLAAPIEHESSLAFGKALDAGEIPAIRAVLDTLDAQCAELMRNEATQPHSSAVRYYADICYVGQAYSIEVPLLPDADDPCGLLLEEFLQAHARIYGYSTRTPARIVNLRAVHQAGGQDSIDSSAYQSTGEPPLRGQRSILVAGQDGPAQADIYRREAMPAGFEFQGPAIVEQADTTTLVEPGWQGRVDDNGNLILTR